MTAPYANIMPQEGERRHAQPREANYDSDHRSRGRKHFALPTMPHTQRSRRKLCLDLECEWDRSNGTPCAEVVSDEYSSIDSNPSVLSNVSGNCNLYDKAPVPLSNLRLLCEDFSFSLDSLNENLTNQTTGPSPPIATTLHCPFAPSSQTTVIPTVNIHERVLGSDRRDTGSRVNLSDYESEAESEEEAIRNYEEEVPLIISSDFSDDDSLQDFVGCPRKSGVGSGSHHRPLLSPSDIPFQQVSNSISTVSTSNSLGSFPTTSSNESLKTVSTTSLSSTELFQCPENYEMLYRNFEIATRMEETQNSLKDKTRDPNRSLSSAAYSSDESGDSAGTFKSAEDGSPEDDSNVSYNQGWSFPSRNSVTTFAKLADSKRKSPARERETEQTPPQSNTGVTHWSEVLSKQTHPSKDSPESGINSPVDQSPESPKVKRPQFLPLPLRHIQHPASKPIAASSEEPGKVDFRESGLLRTFSAPTGQLEYPYSGQRSGQVIHPSALFHVDELSSTATDTDHEEPVQECDDLINWTQAVKQLPSRSSSIDDDHTPRPLSLLDWEVTKQPTSRSFDVNDNDSLDNFLTKSNNGNLFRRHGPLIDHTLKQAPLIDWEDIFTSRQSFCELESPEKKSGFHSLTSNDCVESADINANFSVNTLIGDGHSPLRGTPRKLFEDKAIMTSPFRFRPCNCPLAANDIPELNKSAPPMRREGDSHQSKEEQEASPVSSSLKAKPTLAPLPLQSVDYFSDSDDSLSSLESLEMDDCVFRESLYSLTSEHLYQSQTFNQVTDSEIYEDSLCENTPPIQRSTRFNREPPEEEADSDSDSSGGEVEELYGPRSVMPSCLSENLTTMSLEESMPDISLRSQQGDGSSPTEERVTMENQRNEGVRRRLEGLYQLSFISRENTPKRVIKHIPLKPIRQVDAEYRCRKALEQLTKPSHSQSAPSLQLDTHPKTIFVNTHPTPGGIMVPPQGQRDGAVEGQEDILDCPPPQEMMVSPKADTRCKELEVFDRKRDLVLAVKSAVQQIVQYYNGSTETAGMVTASCSPLKGDIHELVLGQLCPSLEALLRDGKKPFSNSWLVGRVKNTTWVIIQATTQLGPGTRGLNDLYNNISRCALPPAASTRFNAFVMGLLNEDLMLNWMEHCRDHPNIMTKYYEPSAFFTLCNTEPYSELLQELLDALGHLSELRFQLDYRHDSPSVRALSGKTGSHSLSEQTSSQLVKHGSPKRSVTKGKESWSTYVDSKKLTSSMLSFVGKVKDYASSSSSSSTSSIQALRPDTLASEPKENEERPKTSTPRGECDGGPSEGPEVIKSLEERIAVDSSPDRRWSASWIQGFADTVPESTRASRTTATASSTTEEGDESLLPAPKTWSEVFKAAKWQRFGSGWGQMMPKLTWKADGPVGTPVPPLYERQVTGCGTPITGLDQTMSEVTQKESDYSTMRSQVKTRCHYVSLNPGELSFMKGDVLTVRGQPSNEWLNCTLGTESGLVHVDYIKELD